MSDNPRNEVKITLAGAERVMRITFGAVCAIERDLGRSWAKIGDMVAQGTYGMIEVATIIHHGLRGFDDSRMTFQEVGEAVVELGLTNLFAPVAEFTSLGFRGVKGVGKPEAAAPQTQAQ